MSLLQRLAQEEAEQLAGEYADAPEVTPEEQLDSKDVEDELIETSEQATDVEKSSEDLESAGVAMEEYQRSLDLLVISTESSGVNAQTAYVLDSNARLIHHILGIHADSIAKESGTSLEEFKSSSTRLDATKLSLEENESRFKAFFKQIWAFIRSLCKKVVDMVTSFTSLTARLQKRAVKIKQTNQGFKGKFKTQLTESQASEYGKIFGIQSAQKESIVRTTDDMVRNMKKIRTEFYIEQLGRYIRRSIETGTTNKLLQLGRTDVTANVSGREAWNLLRDYLGWMNKDLFGRNPYELANALNGKETNSVRSIWDKGDGKYFQSDVFPGGWSLNIFIQTKKQDALPKISVAWLQTHKPTKSTTFQNKNLPNSSKDVNHVCDNVIEVCKGYSKALETIKGFQKEMRSLVDKYEKECEKDDDPAVTMVKRKIAAFARNSFVSMNAPFVKMIKQMVYLSKKSLDLCLIAMSGSKPLVK